MAAYELESLDEVELLVEACRMLDQAEALQEILDCDGLQVLGSAGQPRVHPAVAELRSSRLALGRLLAQLALPDPEEETLPSPLQARARKAAHARWDRTARLREMRRRGA